MKVLNLQCALQHVFEGWFSSEDDFLTQSEGGLIACPLCGNTIISKRLSAPRLNLGGKSPQESIQTSVKTVEHDSAQSIQDAWLAAARHVLANFENVGSDFANEARRIHYGNAPGRAIRGSATPVQAESLIEEGIAVTSIALPEVLKNSLQ